MPGPTRWSAEESASGARGAAGLAALLVKVAVIVAVAAGVGLVDRAVRPIPAKAKTVVFEPVKPAKVEPTGDGGAPGGSSPTDEAPVGPVGDGAKGAPPAATPTPSSAAVGTPADSAATIAVREIPPDEFNQLINQTGIVEVSVDQVKALLDNQYGRIIDGRQAHERTDGWVPGAIHLTRTMLATDEGLKIAEDLAKENEGFPLIVYCGGPDCDESHHLAQLLIARFPAVFVMKDGMGGWVARGLAVEK